MKTILFTVCSILIASFAFAKKEVPLIYLKPSDTLHVQVMENVGLDGGVGRNFRFANFKSTLEDVLLEVDFPLDFKITRSGSRHTPEGQPRLDLTIMKWGDNGLSEIEARFIASLKRDYNRNKLGVFYYRSGGNLSTTDQITRTYNDVLRKALVKMVTELNSRIVILENLQEEEIEFGEELDDGLSPTD